MMVYPRIAGMTTRIQRAHSTTLNQIRLSHTKYEEPLYLPPAAPRKIHGSVIWLHGKKLDFSAFTDLWFLGIKPKYYRMVLPKAPNSTKTGHNDKISWLGSFSPSSSMMDVKSDEDLQIVQENLSYIHSLIDSECQYTDSENIILGGFGQGAALTLLAGLTYKKPLSGIASVAGYTIMRTNPQIRQQIVESPNKAMQILCLHGQKDDVIPLNYANECYEELKTLGFKGVELHVDDNGKHEVTDLQQKALAVFFGHVVDWQATDVVPEAHKPQQEELF